MKKNIFRQVLLFIFFCLTGNFVFSMESGQPSIIRLSYEDVANQLSNINLIKHREIEHPRESGDKIIFISVQQNNFMKKFPSYHNDLLRMALSLVPQYEQENFKNLNLDFFVLEHKKGVEKPGKDLAFFLKRILEQQEGSYKIVLYTRRESANVVNFAINKMQIGFLDTVIYLDPQNDPNYQPNGYRIKKVYNLYSKLELRRAHRKYNQILRSNENSPFGVDFVVTNIRSVYLDKKDHFKDVFLKGIIKNKNDYKVFKKFNLKIPELIQKSKSFLINDDLTAVIFSEKNINLPISIFFNRELSEIVTGESIFLRDFGSHGSNQELSLTTLNEEQREELDEQLFLERFISFGGINEFAPRYKVDNSKITNFKTDSYLESFSAERTDEIDFDWNQWKERCLVPNNEDSRSTDSVIDYRLLKKLIIQFIKVSIKMLVNRDTLVGESFFQGIGSGGFKYAQALNGTTTDILTFGDLHGNFNALFKIIQDWVDKGYIDNGFNIISDTLIFGLGDYVDRGMSGIENLATLIFLKIKNPYKVFLSRGNHEFVELTRLYGFWREIKQKYPGRYEHLKSLFEQFFKFLPVSSYLVKENDGKVAQLSHAGIEERFDPHFIIEKIQNDPSLGIVFQNIVIAGETGFCWSDFDLNLNAGKEPSKRMRGMENLEVYDYSLKTAFARMQSINTHLKIGGHQHDVKKQRENIPNDQLCDGSILLARDEDGRSIFVTMAGSLYNRQLEYFPTYMKLIPDENDKCGWRVESVFIEN